MMVDISRPLPDWSVSEWFNTTNPLSLEDFRGKVVVIEAFQMLCPGCVSDGLPLARRVQQTFRSDDVAVIGLHTVFEHHDAMMPVSLKAFLHEYQITFPVGVDAPGEHALPQTMRLYGLQGTPSLLLLNRQGELVAHYFGHVDPLKLGAEIGFLAADRSTEFRDQVKAEASKCSPEGCTI